MPLSPNNFSNGVVSGQVRNATLMGIRSSAFNHIGFTRTTITMPINRKLSTDKSSKKGGEHSTSMVDYYK